MSRRLLVLLAVLLLATRLLAETPLTQPQSGPAPGDQYAPVAGTNGSEFLVAWLDGRAIPEAIYANRVAADGRVLDGTGIRIPMEVGGVNARLLGVFRSGGAYTILFSEQFFLPDNASHFATYAVRISDDGRVLEGPRVAIDNFFASTAASNGSRIVVSGPSLAVLDERAELIERDIPLPVSSAYGGGLASNGSTFLLVLNAYIPPLNTVSFTTLDANGHITASSQIIASGIGNAPLVASDGADYLVLYLEGRSGDAITQVVHANGALGAEGVLPKISITPLEGKLTWTGANYLLSGAIMDQQQSMGVAVLSRSGALVDPPRFLGAGTPGTSNPPAAAWNGAQAFIGWTKGTQQDPDAWEITGALVDGSGSVVSGAKTIPGAANAQIAPVIATGGTTDLVAWTEASGIFAARVTPGGSAIEPNGIFIAPQATPTRDLVSFSVPAVRVVFDGEDYVVAWRTADGVQMQRVDDETGALLGPRIAIAPCVQSFDLGRDDAGLLLVGSSCSGFHLFAQRIGIAGAVGGPVAISPSEMPTGNPRIAWNGSEWLVAFNELISLNLQWPAFRGNVFVERLSSALAVADTPIALTASTDTDESSPLVATNGRDFLVVWTRRWANGGVAGRLVRADGSLGDRFALTTDTADARAIVWDGTRYVVAYALMRPDQTHELWLTHAGDDRIPVSTGAPDQRFITLVVASGGALRVAYGRVATEPAYGGVERVFLLNIGMRRRVTR
jgi:hypothetical protein